MANDEKEPGIFISRTYLISAGVVALIAILGIAVVGTILWPDGETEQPEAAASPEGDPPAEAVTAPTYSDSVCDLPASDATTLDTPPKNTEWEFVGAMQAPSIPDVGPGIIEENGFRRCYAHSPEGALVAAANVLAMGTDPNLVYDLNDKLVAKGPGRDAVLEKLETNPPTSEDGVRLSIVGFQLMGYGPNHARIDLAVEGSNGTLASVTTDLAWEDGDWKVELDPTGQPIIPTAPLTDAFGYLPWSAEG